MWAAISQHGRVQIGVAVVAALAAMALTSPQPVAAGCGCEKPPPVIEAVRPHAAYPTVPITLFAAGLEEGRSYIVTFIPDEGAPVELAATAETRRDRADGAERVLIVVPLPELPLGPVSVRVRAYGESVVLLAVDDTALTVTADPLALPNERGAWTYPDLQAAVGRNGTLYLAFDLQGMTQPLVLTAQALGLPLRFTAEDVVIYNAQGVLMQLLVDAKAEPVPGMFVKPAATPESEGDVLHYSRHEFVTYFLQHEERQAHAVDADGWHTDGTPHIDHDHLILAIQVTLPHGGTLAPGRTPMFDLALTAYSLFHGGLVGVERAEVAGEAVVDSYTSDTMELGGQGRVYSPDTVILKDDVVVYGDVVAAQVERKDRARVMGRERTLASASASYMAVEAPAGIPELGAIALKGTSEIIEGPGTFLVEEIKLDEGAEIFIDNAAGPVTLYVEGGIELKDGCTISVLDPAAENFAIYSVDDKPVKLEGDGSLFAGVVYAPRSDVLITGTSEFSGAFVGKIVKMEKGARVHYDSRLRGHESDMLDPSSAD